MFKTIFQYELKYWIKQPAIYVFAFFLCLLPMLQAAEWAGVFAEKTKATELVKLANSPTSILAIFNKFLIFILFLLPTIFGRTLARDFHQNIHAVLYSFPIKKRDYLFAKFGTALLLTLIVITFAGLGIFIGTNFLGHDPHLVLPFDTTTYFHIYAIYLIPNVLFCGTIVFAIVLYARNIYAGFIGILFLYFIQMLIGSSLSNGSTDFLAALLDPFGQFTTGFYTKNWTLTERNQQPLPMGQLVIYNRLLWLSITTLLFVGIYKKFQFQQNSPSLFKNGFSTNLNPFKANLSRNAFLKNQLIFRNIIDIKLPKVKYVYSFSQQLKNVWALSIFELKYILSGGLFFSVLLAGIGVIIFKQAEINPAYGEETLPMTWKMLGFPMHNASIIIIILTFLYAGLLVHRSRRERTHFLIDSSPVSNWVLLGAKFLALLKMQAVLLLLVLLGGIMVQIVNGFYDFELGHYLFELYGLQWVTFIIWAFVALFVQTLFGNPYLGFFMLLMGWMGTAHLHLIGLDHNVFKYNWGPNFYYSDLTGYGTSLPLYLSYKFYWSLFGLFLLLGTLCWWNRGIPNNFMERFNKAFAKLKSIVGIIMGLLLLAFFSLGYFLWYEDQVKHKSWNGEAKERISQKMTTAFNTLKALPQPKIQSINLSVDLFPQKNDFRIKGTHVLVNTTQTPIDSLIISTPLWFNTTFEFDQSIQPLLKDTAMMVYDMPFHFEVLKLTQPLLPDETLLCHFQVQNPPNTFLRKNSPVQVNGTFMQSPLFPRIGYWSNDELPTVLDTSAAYTMHESPDSDWVDFEAIIRTDKDQIALAPGDLQRQWSDKNHVYFHYKTPQKIPLYGAFFSANYTITKDQWQDVDLAIYHHPQHEYNVEAMLHGLKTALTYNTDNFGPYPLKQAKIAETPSIYGNGGSSFAGTMSVSERAGFIAKVDAHHPTAANTPFFIAVHEFSHQWWKLQLNPAAAKGSDMLMEALCQYTAFKCLEKEFGRDKMLAFLRNERNWYFEGRTHTNQIERPLLEIENEAHLAYAKGSLVFYTLSEYLGEKPLNRAIKQFYDKFKLQPAPYGTALDLVEEIRGITPDSLQYLVTDLFEKVTFYDNQLVSTKIEQTLDKKYEVTINFSIQKYHINAKEEKVAQPLKDYVEIGVFDSAGKVLYLQKQKMMTNENQLKMTVNELPAKIGIDPYFKLIERNLEDNQVLLQ